MRYSILGLMIALFVATGCGKQPVVMRDEPVEIKGIVKIPGGESPKDLTVTFQPQQNTFPGGSKLGSNGSFTVKLVPGKYIVFFDSDANKGAESYKKIPEAYKKPSAENEVSVDGSGQNLVIDVK